MGGDLLTYHRRWCTHYLNNLNKLDSRLKVVLKLML